MTTLFELRLTQEEATIIVALALVCMEPENPVSPHQFALCREVLQGSPVLCEKLETLRYAAGMLAPVV